MVSSTFVEVKVTMKMFLGLIFAMNAMTTSHAFIPHQYVPGTFNSIHSSASASETFSTLFIFGKKNKKSTSAAEQDEPQVLQRQISSQRRKQLGIPDDEREYDLGVALEQNTDPLITKVIAGSFILVVFALLIAGIVIPSLTDYGEGVCNPILTSGRC